MIAESRYAAYPVLAMSAAAMKHQPELVRVAASPEFMLNGVAVSPRGRVFASFPRWTSLAAPSVMEAMPGGGFKPWLYFPSSQAHRLPFFNSGVSRIRPPFEVFRLKI